MAKFKITFMDSQFDDQIIEASAFYSSGPSSATFSDTEQIWADADEYGPGHFYTQSNQIALFNDVHSVVKIKEENGETGLS